MIEPIPLATAEKSVVGQKSKRLKKTEWKEENQMHLGSNKMLPFFFT